MWIFLSETACLKCCSPLPHWTPTSPARKEVEFDDDRSKALYRWVLWRFLEAVMTQFIFLKRQFFRRSRKRNDDANSPLLSGYRFFCKTLQASKRPKSNKLSPSAKTHIRLVTTQDSGVVGELKRYLLMNLSSEKKNKETTKILLKTSSWIPWKKIPWKIDHRHVTMIMCLFFMDCKDVCRSRNLAKKNKTKINTSILGASELSK